MPVNGLTFRPSRDETQTIRPAPRLIICLAIGWVSSSGPVTLTSNWCRMLAAGMSTVEPPLADPRVVDQDLHSPVERLAAVAVVGDVELLDLQGHSALGRLSLHRLDLGVDLHPGDHVEALLRQAHGGLSRLPVLSNGSGSAESVTFQWIA
jgi:hypothetical protein